MVIENKKLILSTIIYLFLIMFTISFVSADFNTCWQYSGSGNATCVESGGSGCHWETSVTDPWCMNSIGCCMDVGCWDYDGTNSTICEANNGGMNCTWDPYMTMYWPENNSVMSIGGDRKSVV